MSGRNKKKQRADVSAGPARIDGTGAPAAGKRRDAHRGKPQGPSGKWRPLAIYASIAGLALGAIMIALSLISVATSDDPRPTTPVAGAKPGALPSQAGAATPASPGGQEVDPRRLELRTKGDPQAPVVVTEWFDFL
jgi:hypothetical protein